MKGNAWRRYWLRSYFTTEERIGKVMEGTNNTVDWENPGSLSLGFSAIFKKFESFEGHETKLLFETVSLGLLNNFQLSERRPCSRNSRSCNLKEIFLLLLDSVYHPRAVGFLCKAPKPVWRELAARGLFLRAWGQQISQRDRMLTLSAAVCCHTVWSCALSVSTLLSLVCKRALSRKPVRAVLRRLMSHCMLQSLRVKPYFNRLVLLVKFPALCFESS